MEEADWDRVAATFEEEVLIVSEHDQQQKLLNTIKRLAIADGTAADLGCGIGSTIGLLAQSYAKVFAVDISSRCLERARRANARFRNVQYIHADLTLPLPLPPVDLVLCINVLLTIDPARQNAMLDRICTAVKPGGHLLLVVPSLESTLYASHRLVRLNEKRGMSPKAARSKAKRDTTGLDMGIVRKGGTPTKHYLKEELVDLLMQRGMQVLELQKIEYPWSFILTEAPQGMRAPLPWNWMVLAERQG